MKRNTTLMTEGLRGDGEISDEGMSDVAGGHVCWTKGNILSTPRGEPVADMVRDGKPVYLPQPEIVKELGEKLRAMLS